MSGAILRILGNSFSKVSSRNKKLLNKQPLQIWKQRISTECTSGYRTRIALPMDYKTILSFLSEHYLKCEAVHKYLGLAERAPAPELIKILYMHIKKGYTIIAQNDNGCLLGVAVNSGSCPWDSYKAMNYASTLEPGPVRDVIELFAYVDREPNLWETHLVDRLGHRVVFKILECVYLAVDSEYQNQGIGRRLLEESYLLSVSSMHPLFRVNCTNRIGCEIAEAIGCECVFTMPYKEYTRDGKRVFTKIDDSACEIRSYVKHETEQF